MKFLITGVSGFIGMHVCKRLLDSGYEVIGIDNINSYYDVSLKKDRLKQIHSKNNQFKFYKIDILEYKKLEKVFEESNFDYVIHLAAQAGVRYSLENPKSYIDSNLNGFFNIIELSKIYSVKHFYYASSSSVYGLNKKFPWKENHNTDAPAALYGATKKSNELIAFSYSNLFKLKTTGLRFFTVYGPWGRPDMSLFIFTKAIFEGKQIKLYNKGDMVRDFTYIDDVTEAIFKLVNINITTKDNDIENNFEIFNIGLGEPISLMKYIEIIEKEIGKKASINYLPMQKGDIKFTFADNTKLKKYINFMPKVTPKEGIRSFVNWYKKYYKIIK